MATAHAPRTRRSFARLNKVLEVPNLIDIQRKSFAWLTDPDGGGLRETIDDISPIEDYTGNLAVQFGEFTFDEPVASLEQCREKDLTYARPLTVTVAFINRETGEIREQSVFMGDFPWMTERGTFIINGTERVVVTQLVRSPGAYVMEPKDREKQVFIANLMPARGSWLELEIDKKGRVYVRIDRKRKLPVTVLLRAMGYASDEEILKLFDNSLYIRLTLDADAEMTRTEEGALIELFKKQRPGEPPSIDAAKALLHQLFFDPKRYDLTRVGRYKLNSRLGLDIDLDTRTLTHDDIIALVKELVSLPKLLGMPEEPDEEIKDFAAEALSISREPIQDHLDEYEHFGNRRLRTVGELIQEAFRIGLYRMERVVRERLTTEDADTITPQTIVNIRPVVAALKEFFGSSQLSQFMDQTNSLAGLTHRRRLSALGAGGLTRERAPIEVRDVHPTHYGRMCPIETPEGPNIGLIGSLSSYAEISEHGFVTTPYRVVKNGKVTDEIVHIDATQEEERMIAQANTPVDDNGQLLGDEILCRTQAGQYVTVDAGGGRPDRRLAGADLVGRDGDDPVPRARRREPRADGLEHAAPGGAAAGHRRAAGRHRDGAPRGDRHRRRDRRRRRRDGLLRRRRADRRRAQGRRPGRVRAAEVHALEPGHADPPEADRRRRRRASRRATCSPTARRPTRRDGARQEPARRLHVLGGLQLRGRDHPLQAARPGRRAHLDPHRGVRDRRPHDEARRRGDHARHPEPLGGVAAQPRRPRHRPDRRRGRARATCSSARSRRRARPS